jgi:DNA-binding transcriptional ArsR family regulator
MTNEAHLDHVFGALAHSTRRALLAQLRAGEASVGELAEPHRMSLPAISRHLKILEEAGLIGRTTNGKFRSCHLRLEAIDRANTWIEEHRAFWSHQLYALGEYVQELSSTDPPTGRQIDDAAIED